MQRMNAESQPSTRRLILVPAVITLAVTLLRLVGELNHWAGAWFTTDMGASVVGIVWLAPAFGVYFALKLSASGQAPNSAWRALAFAALGIAVAIIMTRGFTIGAIAPRLHLSYTFHTRLLYGWSVIAVAAVATLPGWPALFQTLLAYAYAARVPVAIIMFFAYRGHWGTHYDAVPPDFPARMGLASTWLWMAFFPQLVFWVGFTVVSGMLFGSVAVALVSFLRSLAPLLARRSD